jgi:hypothetical protein
MQAQQTRVVWVVIAVLALLMGGIAIAVKPTKEEKGAVPGARALIVPDDRTRTVLVPPCASGTNVTSNDPAKVRAEPGTVEVTLPAGGAGSRTVAVPHCNSDAGTQTAGGGPNLPSALYVLGIGTNVRPGTGGEKTLGAGGLESQLVLPTGSSATTIVVTACEEKKSSDENAKGPPPTSVLPSKPPRPGQALVAPPC